MTEHPWLFCDTSDPMRPVAWLGAEVFRWCGPHGVRSATVVARARVDGRAIDRVDLCAYCGGPFAQELSSCPHCGAAQDGGPDARASIEG